MIRLLILFLAILVLSCGNSSVADTTSSSEVTNGIAITAIMPDGSPVTGCVVSLIDQSNWYKLTAEGKSTVSESGTTGTDGSVTFDSLAPGSFSIVITGEKVGGRKIISFSAKEKESVTIVLSSLNQISGNISSFAGKPMAVRIAGTDISANCDSEGNFSLPQVPGDSSEIVAVVSANSNSILAFGKGVTGTGSIQTGEIQVEPNAVLLDDFNDGDRFSIFGWFTGHGLWYAYDDSWLGGNSTVIPSEALTNPAIAISSIDAWQGKSMSISFVMGNTISTPHASFACQLREQADQYANLSGLRRLSCRVKGKGTMRVNFISSAVDNFGAVAIRGDFGSTVTLSDQWTELSIDMDSITPEPESAALKAGLRWSDVSDSIRSIVFGSWSSVPGDTVQIQLDDVILHGVDPAVYQNR